MLLVSLPDPKTIRSHVSRTSPEVQVSAKWNPPTGTLGELVAAARDRAASLRPRQAELADAARAAPAAPSFSAALRRADVGVVAEVKRRSPSLGVINAGLQAADQAAAFVAGGAAAVSILTEPMRFGGSPEDLSAARARVAVPLLRKDFLVDALQLIEARALGASAVLLIVRALDLEGLRDLIDAATALGLEQLVEVHSETELEMALVAGARIVGVNNRNLETLQVAPTTATRIIPEVPADLLALAESGITDRADVIRAADSGADAVLIGSALSRALDPEAAVAAFVGVPRTRRRQSP